MLYRGGDSYFPCGRKIDEKIGQTPSDQAEILTAKNMDIEEYSLKFSAF